MDVATMATTIAKTRPILFKRVIVFAGRFDPIGNHHFEIILKLIELRDALRSLDPEIPVNIVVWPVGEYAGKEQRIPVEQHIEMLEACLADLDVSLNTHDLENKTMPATSTYTMQEQLSFAPQTAMREKYFTPLYTPGVLTEVWHVLGADNVPFVKEWDFGSDLWKSARFVVLTRKGHVPESLPVRSLVLDIGTTSDSSTQIRSLIAAGKPWEHFVPIPVATYIKEHNLYQSEKEKISS